MTRDQIIRLIIKYAKGGIKISGQEISLFCPFCSGKGMKLYFNTVKHAWWCHRCQERGRGLKVFLYRVLGIPYEEIGKLSKSLGEATWEAQKQQTLKRLIGFATNGRIFLDPAPLKDAVRVLDNTKALCGREVVDYLYQRGFTDATIRLLDPYISLAYPNWFVLPVKMDGELVYWVRRTQANHEPKYLGPRVKEEDGKQKYLGKGDVLWGYDFLEDGGVCVICEGILSAASVVQSANVPAVAMLGKVLSTRQRNLLIDKNLSGIVIMLDGRSEGDNTLERSDDIYRNLVDFFPFVRKVTLSEGKDPNDLIGTPIEINFP